MDPDQPGRVKPRPPQACLKAPVTDNPFWWPEIAAAASDPKSFGAHTLPKSSKLPKAGAAIKQGPAALYDVSTLTSTASKVQTILTMCCCTSNQQLQYSRSHGL